MLIDIWAWLVVLHTAKRGRQSHYLFDTGQAGSNASPESGGATNKGNTTGNQYGQENSKGSSSQPSQTTFGNYDPKSPIIPPGTSHHHCEGAVAKLEERIDS